MKVNELAGVLTAVLILAGVAVAIKNASGTANIMRQSMDGFAGVVRAATLQ
jgi:hypothetical protein